MQTYLVLDTWHNESLGKFVIKCVPNTHPDETIYPQILEVTQFGEYSAN